MNRKPLWLLLSVLSLSACKEKATEPPPLASAAAAPAPTPPPAATPVATAAAPAPAATLPTPEDYEQQAIDQINPQNMDSELNKLEKDIGQ